MNILVFLKALSQNNNRDWFETHRKEYELAKKEFSVFVNASIQQIGKFDSSIIGMDAKKCMFRINRDIRFSKDKTPYKISMSAFMANGGKGSQKAGYYVHIEPDNCFIGGGIYAPEPEIQQAIRNEIYFNAKEFLDILNQSEFVINFGSMLEEKYSRIPKGFPSDFKNGDLLKYKHYVVSCKISVDDFQLTDIQYVTIKYFNILTPFIQFLNRAISNA